MIIQQYPTVVPKFMKQFLTCVALTTTVCPIASAMEPAEKPAHSAKPLELVGLPRDIWIHVIFPHFIKTQDIINLGSVSRALREAICSLHGSWKNLITCPKGDLPPKLKQEIYMLLLYNHPTDVVEMVRSVYGNIRSRQPDPTKVLPLKVLVYKIFFSVIEDLNDMPLDKQQDAAVKSKFHELVVWERDTCDDGITPKKKGENCVIQ